MALRSIRTPLTVAGLLGFWAMFAWAYFTQLPVPNPIFSMTLLFVIGGITLLGFLGWGGLLCRRWIDERCSALEWGMFAVVSGFGVVSFLMIGLGVIGFWSRRGALALLVTGVYFSLASLRELRLRVSGRDTSLFTNQVPVAQCLSAFAAVTSALLIFTPPTYYDTLVYHYALPALYVQAHHWLGLPTMIYSAFPQNLEMLWTYGFLLANDTLANFIGWSLAVCLVGAVLSFGNRFFDARTGWWSAALVAVMPATLLLSSGGYVDIGLALFSFVSFYALCLWIQRPSPGLLIIAGLLAGWTIGVKYTGAISFAIGFILVIWESRQRPLRSIAGNAMLYGLPAVAMMMPWLIKNWHYVGNPVFPFFYRWSLKSLSPWVGQAAAGYFSGLMEYQPRSLWHLPFLLWDAAVHGSHFGRGMDVLGDFGWAPLFAFLPALWLAPKQSPIAKWLLAYSVLFLIPWGVSRPVLRFLLPLAPILSVLSVHAWLTGAVRAGGLVRSGARLLLALWIISGFLIFFHIAGLLSSFSVVFGLETRGEYLMRQLDHPYYGAAEYINHQLPEDILVYVVGDQRGYYYHKPVIVTPVFNSNPLAGWANQAADAGALRQTLRNRGITHLVINYSEMDRLRAYNIFPWSPHGQENWTHLLTHLAHSLYKDRACEVFAL